MIRQIGSALPGLIPLLAVFAVIYLIGRANLLDEGPKK